MRWCPQAPVDGGTDAAALQETRKAEPAAAKAAAAAAKAAKAAAAKAAKAAAGPDPIKAMLVEAKKTVMKYNLIVSSTFTVILKMDDPEKNPKWAWAQSDEDAKVLRTSFAALRAYVNSKPLLSRAVTEEMNALRKASDPVEFNQALQDMQKIEKDIEAVTKIMKKVQSIHDLKNSD